MSEQDNEKSTKKSFLNVRKGKIAYMVDKWFKKSLSLQLISLLIFVVFTAVGGAFLASLIGSFSDFPKNLWWAFLRITDAGYLGEDSELWIGMAGTIVILFGLVFFGLLISILTSAFEERLKEIKDGHRPVIEEKHILILGWGDVVFSIIDELYLAQEDLARSQAVVVLSHISQDEMEKSLDNYCNHKNKGQVVLRTGQIDSINDLKRMSIQYAEQVIIITDDHSPDPRLEDARALKACLAILQIIHAKKGHTETPKSTKDSSFRIRVAASLFEERTAKIFRYLASVYPEIFLHVIVKNDLIGRIIAQSSFQIGLHEVFVEILSFEDNEIYLKPIEELQIIEKTEFDTLLHTFPKAIPIGYERDGKVYINPLKSLPLTKGDRLIFLAKDYKLDYQPALGCKLQERLQSQPPPIPPQSILLVGTGDKAKSILQHLEIALPHGSTVIYTHEEKHIFKQQTDRPINFEHRLVTKTQMDLPSIITEALTSPHPCDCLILVHHSPDREKHDSEILLQLAETKKIEREKIGQSSTRTISEFLDHKNAKLADALGTKLTLVSTKVISDSLVQAVYEPARVPILDELLSARGNEIGMMPAELLLDFQKNKEVVFSDVMLEGRKQGLIIIGYRFKDEVSKLNPDKNVGITAKHTLIYIGDVF